MLFNENITVLADVPVFRHATYIFPFIVFTLCKIHTAVFRKVHRVFWRVVYPGKIGTLKTKTIIQYYILENKARLKWRQNNNRSCILENRYGFLSNHVPMQGRYLYAINKTVNINIWSGIPSYGRGQQNKRLLSLPDRQWLMTFGSARRLNGWWLIKTVFGRPI